MKPSASTTNEAAPIIGKIAVIYRGTGAFEPDIFIITRLSDTAIVRGSICEVRDGTGEDIYDPQTNEFLGTYFIFKGHIHIMECYDRFFVCSRSVMAGGLFPEVSVGDEVRYVANSALG